MVWPLGRPAPGEGFSCKPDVLRDLAKQADTIGGEIVGDASFTAGSSSAATGVHGGWRFAAALGRAQSVWEQNMTDFGEQVMDVGGRLRASAKTYEDSDQRTSNTFRGM